LRINFANIRGCIKIRDKLFGFRLPAFSDFSCDARRSLTEERLYDSAVTCFMNDFEACIAHLRFTVTHRRAIRTTNLLERLFVEECRRLKIIPNAFGERAV
jgi:transposase-like protein